LTAYQKSSKDVGQQFLLDRTKQCLEKILIRFMSKLEN